MPKIVAQCRKNVIPYLFTLKRTIAYAYILPNAIAYLNTCIAYLNTCLTYLNTLTRLSAPYPNTLNRHDSYRQPIRIEHPRTLGTRQPIRIKYYVTRVVSQSESSSFGSRQPIRIGYYVTRVVSQSESSSTSPKNTRELSARVEVPSRLSGRLGSL